MSKRCLLRLPFVYMSYAGSFDSSVHISEEASNAATAVPWAIVYAIGIAGVLGWGALLQPTVFGIISSPV